MTGKGTITILGGKKSLIQKLQKSRNSEYIEMMCLKWRRRRRRRRRSNSLLNDPLVLIMTPFFIILDIY
jgi:hypothetical protein